MKIKKCRVCGENLNEILSLGAHPIVNYFPKKSELAREKKYPLIFSVCKSCGLSQLGFIIPPKSMFENYHYMSSMSRPLVEYLQGLAEQVVKKYKLKKHTKVLDIGCNDGTLLKSFKEKGMQTLGIDPSKEAYKIAHEQGIEVLRKFFTVSSASHIAKKFGKFDLIISTHTLANILDLNSFFRGIQKVIAPRGLLVIEVGSVEAMLSSGQFDSIYHEHYNYFSKKSLKNILGMFGFEVLDIMESTLHGGSIRVFARKGKVSSAAVPLDKDEIDKYLEFAEKVKIYKKRVKAFFSNLGKDAKIVGYGAPAKSITYLTYCGIGKSYLKYIVDSTPIKQKRYLPGLHIPIYSMGALIRGDYTHIFLLAWNYEDYATMMIGNLIPSDTKVIRPYPTAEIINVRKRLIG